jgi:hypothetical protein
MQKTRVLSNEAKGNIPMSKSTTDEHNLQLLYQRAAIDERLRHITAPAYLSTSDHPDVASIFTTRTSDTRTSTFHSYSSCIYRLHFQLS